MPRDTRWKDAVVDALVVTGIYRKAHEDDPKGALNDLLVWHQDFGQDIGRGLVGANEEESE